MVGVVACLVVSKAAQRAVLEAVRAEASTAAERVVLRAGQLVDTQEELTVAASGEQMVASSAAMLAEERVA